MKTYATWRINTATIASANAIERWNVPFVQNLFPLAPDSLAAAVLIRFCAISRLKRPRYQ
jgi:hypothetical protein